MIICVLTSNRGWVELGNCWVKSLWIDGEQIKLILMGLDSLGRISNHL